MHDNPSVIAALDSMPTAPEPFGQQAIMALFKSCITASGLETPRRFAVINKLWQSECVLSAIDELQLAHETERDTSSARRALISKIEAEIRG